MVEQKALEPAHDRLGGRSQRDLDLQDAAPARSQIEQPGLHAHQLGLVLPGVDATLHAHHGVVGQQVAVLLHGAGEDPRLDGRLHVLQDERRHQLPLLGVLAAQVGDHPAHDLDLRLPSAAGHRLIA